MKTINPNENTYYFYYEGTEGQKAYQNKTRMCQYYIELVDHPEKGWSFFIEHRFKFKHTYIANSLEVKRYYPDADAADRAAQEVLNVYKNKMVKG